LDYPSRGDANGRHLTLAQVFAALTYYQANREGIEADIVAEEAEADQLEQEVLSKRAVSDDDSSLSR